MEDESAMVHDRSMTATENLKATKPAKVVAGKSDGTLSKLNLGKLNTALSAFADSAQEMEASLLTATTSSDVISCVGPAALGGEMRNGCGISCT